MKISKNENVSNSITINNAYTDINPIGLFKASIFLGYIGLLSEQELRAFKMFFEYLKMGVNVTISPYEYEDSDGDKFYYYYFGKNGSSTQRVRIYCFDGIEHFNAMLIKYSVDVTFDELYKKAVELTKED